MRFVIPAKCHILLFLLVALTVGCIDVDFSELGRDVREGAREHGKELGKNIGEGIREADPLTIRDAHERARNSEREKEEWKRKYLESTNREIREVTHAVLIPFGEHRLHPREQVEYRITGTAELAPAGDRIELRVDCSAVDWVGKYQHIVHCTRNIEVYRAPKGMHIVKLQYSDDVRSAPDSQATYSQKGPQMNWNTSKSLTPGRRGPGMPGDRYCFPLPQGSYWESLTFQADAERRMELIGTLKFSVILGN